MFIDGASRNNPGPAGAGIYLLKNGDHVGSYHFYLGLRTNNQAEYMALILGLLVIRTQISDSDFLLIFSDSQLLVRQINGHYKVKEQGLKSLHALAVYLLASFTYHVDHIMREENEQADFLANKGVDDRTIIPIEYRDILRGYGIVFE